MMTGKSRIFQLLVVASSAIALFAIAGCGGGGPSDDTGVAQDSVVADSVEPNDVATDVAVSGDERPVDTSTPDSVDDVDTDASDISCGICTGGKICVDGECSCPATQKDCAGTCTTLGTNADCSECGDQCPTGGSCEAGTCSCPGVLVDCSGTCSPLGTDDNCSGCGDACVGVKICQNKECVAEVDPECLPSVPCVTDDDCVSGNRCNQVISPPACQKLYCGGFGTACSEDYFCLSQVCAGDACINDCSGLECGPDPVYGESCGTCQEGATCRSNHCACEPQDHLECVAGNSTWIDSCGNVGEVKEGCPLACLNGACVDCEAVGKMNCSGTCTLIGTITNCSECGDACTGGKECGDGTCECPVGEADCSGTCTLTGTITNCSGCGDSCPVGGSCEDGTCECPVDKADCSGTCTLMGTTTNCSGCGNVCPVGGSCEDGTCECPVGEADCFGTCTLMGTLTNCSECTDICDAGQLCDGLKCLDDPSMALIPAGSFWMGCNGEVDNCWSSEEKPFHEVTLSGFYMDKTEVTQGEYKKCVDAGSCDTPNFDWDPTVTPNHPVVTINWFQALEYCEWKGKRLPTEAEWEKAARGTDGRKYPWGNEDATCEYAVMVDTSTGEYGCGLDDKWDVCSKSPAGDSPYGLCDMAGNVSEWVSDWYDSDYYGSSPSSNPAGPSTGSSRVRRGGSGYDANSSIRTSSRSFYSPENDDPMIGFRCVRSQ